MAQFAIRIFRHFDLNCRVMDLEAGFQLTGSADDELIARVSCRNQQMSR